MNKVILMGRLVAEPNVKRFDDGGQITSYRLAVDRPFKNRKGEREADFILCQTTGARAEFAEKWLAKGMMIAVSGALRVKSWKNQDGSWNNMTYVDVMEHYFTGVKSDNQRVSEMPASEEPVKGEPKGQTDYKPADDDDDELPF